MGRFVCDSFSPFLSPLPLRDLVSFDSVLEKYSNRRPLHFLRSCVSLVNKYTFIDGIQTPTRTHNTECRSVVRHSRYFFCIHVIAALHHISESPEYQEAGFTRPHCWGKGSRRNLIVNCKQR